jgi:hypothetical protein
MPRPDDYKKPFVPSAVTGIGSTIGLASSGDVVQQTVLFLDHTPITTVGATGVGFGSVLLGAFPAGRILLLGTTVSLAFPIISTEGDLANTADGDFAMGTIACTDGDLTDATDVNILPKTATSANSLSTAVGAALAASAQIDGTSTDVPVYISVALDDAETDETSIVGATGTVTLTWVNLGDY